VAGPLLTSRDMGEPEEDAKRVPRSLKSEARTFTYVYLIESVKTPSKRYIGLTNDLRRRIREHNQGKSIFTAAERPWKLVTYLAFSEKRQARAFEKYLKQHSGQAFANKRLW